VLSVDNNFISLRKKITAKFIPRIQPSPQKNNKEKNSPTLASIKRLPPPIPAKSLKEVNAISKFFKSDKMDNSSLSKTKFYTQASKQNASMSDIIKIKEIDQINNIVKGFPKPKCCIQMTTKNLSRKQVIIPMSNNNIEKFIKKLLDSCC